MYLDTDFPPGSDRPAMLLRVVAAFERDEIEAAVDGFIAMLDARDGDPDLELSGDERDASYPEGMWGNGPLTRLAATMSTALNLEDAESEGDEEDGSRAEDDFCQHYGEREAAGCPIADPDYGADDFRSDPSWTEWHQRGRHKVTPRGEPIGLSESDDAEDDDPKEDDDSDRCPAGDDEIASGPVVIPYGWHLWANERIGDDVDAEYGFREHRFPTYRLDQRRPIEATTNTPAAMFT